MRDISRDTAMLSYTNVGELIRQFSQLLSVLQGNPLEPESRPILPIIPISIPILLQYIY
jgi:hypothetical protein